MQRNKGASDGAKHQTNTAQISGKPAKPTFYVQHAEYRLPSGTFENAPRTQELTVPIFGDLRYVLQQQSQRRLIPLEMEVDCIRRYLNIYQTRLGSRLQYRIRDRPGHDNLPRPLYVSPAACGKCDPPRHQRPLPQGGISIRSHKERTTLLIEIHDNGTVLTAMLLNMEWLKNVMQRIELYYNARGHVHIDSANGTGDANPVSIPRK